jgi:hypothetical protein
MTYILKFIRNIYIPLLELSVRYLLSATPTPIRYHPAICYSLRPVKNTILDTYLNNLSRYISRIALFMGRREYLLPWVEEREARPAAGRRRNEDASRLHLLSSRRTMASWPQSEGTCVITERTCH